MRRLAVLLAVVATSSRPLPCLKKRSAAAADRGDAAATAAPPPPTTKQSTPSFSAAPPERVPPIDTAALETVKDAFAHVDWDVAHGVVKDKSKTDELDAVAECATIDEMRPRLESRTEPDVRKLLDDSQRLCSFDVPILNATETLRHVTISPSQASRRLMCGFAKKDIAKARAVRADDRRVRDLDSRWQRTCQ